MAEPGCSLGQFPNYWRIIPKLMKYCEKHFDSCEIHSIGYELPHLHLQISCELLEDKGFHSLTQ